MRIADCGLRIAGVAIPHSACRIPHSGQAVIEYAVWLVVVIAALSVMSIYLKRGLSGGFRSAANAFGGQYAPGHTAANFTLSESGTTTTTSTLVKDKELEVEGETVNVDVVESVTTIDPANPETTHATGTLTVEAPATGGTIWNTR